MAVDAFLTLPKGPELAAALVRIPRDAVRRELTKLVKVLATSEK